MERDLYNNDIDRTDSESNLGPQLSRSQYTNYNLILLITAPKMW